MFDSIKRQIANVFSIYLEHLISVHDSCCFVNMFEAHSLLENTAVCKGLSRF